VYPFKAGHTYLFRTWVFMDFYDHEGHPLDDPNGAEAGIEIADVDLVWFSGLPMDAWSELQVEWTPAHDVDRLIPALCGKAKWGMAGNTFWWHGLRMYEVDGDAPPDPPPDDPPDDPPDEDEVHYYLHVDGLTDLGDEVRGLRDEVARLVDAMPQGVGGGGLTDEARAFWNAHLQRVIDAITADPTAPVPMDENGHYTLTLDRGAPYIQQLRALRTMGPEEAVAFLQQVVGGEMGHGVKPFSQNDPRWANEVYAGGALFKDYGCLTVGYCMVASQVYPALLPPLFARQIEAAGAYSGPWLSYPGHIPEAYPLLHWREVAADVQRLQMEIHEYGPVVCEVLWDVFKPLTWVDEGGETHWNQHFVVVTHVDVPNDEAHIIDPWDGEAKLLGESQYAEPRGWGAGRAIHGMRLLQLKE
jgi:hypothetical protein